MHSKLLYTLVMLVSSTAVVQATPNGSCKDNEFLWSEKSYCLIRGGPAGTPSLPSGKSCPDDWYWHTGKNCCAPRRQPASNNAPSCPGTHIWDKSLTCCRVPAKNDCKNDEFWFQKKQCCLRKGGDNSPGSPPTDNSCPKSWYWHSPHQACRPRQQKDEDDHNCSGDTDWDDNACSCKSRKSEKCNNGYFWWPGRSSCLPHGGKSPRPSPPRDIRCPPSNWQWSNEHSCCVPQHPSPPDEPDCDNGWEWNKPSMCCKPHGPRPSGAPHYKRKMKRQQNRLNFCPGGYSTCPVRGAVGEFECIDTTSELESCGGCVSVGFGQDCNLINNATSSSCIAGTCIVLACERGYRISDTQEFCQPLQFYQVSK